METSTHATYRGEWVRILSVDGGRAHVVNVNGQDRVVDASELKDVRSFTLKGSEV